ncbi:MAG: globin [Gammaproteobacteria bacterium]|nr:globin [Gammaproteobacteria bacterium]
MDETTLQIYNDSFEACIARPEFLPRFYEIFIGASPEIRERFRHTDLRKQCRIVRKSLYVLTLAAVGTDEARQEIARLGASHGQTGMGIAPHLYDLWLQCLLQAVSEFDPAWSERVERSWRQMFEPHLAALKRFS